MSPRQLTQAERDLLVVLCELALQHGEKLPSAESAIFNEFTAHDYRRCRSLIELLSDPEPREPELGGADEPPQQYHPPGGRL